MIIRGIIFAAPGFDIIRPTCLLFIHTLFKYSYTIIYMAMVEAHIYYPRHASIW